jgi:hypothetical protein
MELSIIENGLVRVSSKRFFRKWKSATITLLEASVTVKFHDDRSELINIPLDPQMKLSNVFEQKNGSLTEGKRGIVYFCRLVRETIGALGEAPKKTEIGPTGFLDENETESILKFGSFFMNDLVEFAKVLDQRLTSSPTWELVGRRRFASKTEDDDSDIRDVGRRYRGSVSASPQVSKKTLSHSGDSSRNSSPQPQFRSISGVNSNGGSAEQLSASTSSETLVGQLEMAMLRIPTNASSGSNPSIQTSSRNTSWERFEFEDALKS